MYKKPTTLTASRAFVLKGTAIAKGATLTGPFPRSIQALLAKRWVYPTPLTYGPLRGQVAKPGRSTPTFIHHKLINSLSGTVGPFIAGKSAPEPQVKVETQAAPVTQTRSTRKRHDNP